MPNRAAERRADREERERHEEAAQQIAPRGVTLVAAIALALLLWVIVRLQQPGMPVTP